MATGFGDWMAAARKEKGLGQAELARKVGINRDRMHKLEHGIPLYPDPALVKAVAEAVGRPVTEALESMGYDLPAAVRPRLNPKMEAELRKVPWEIQERIALVVPGLIEMASVVATGERRPQMVAEGRAKYRTKALDARTAVLNNDRTEVTAKGGSPDGEGTAPGRQRFPGPARQQARAARRGERPAPGLAGD